MRIPIIVDVTEFDIDIEIVPHLGDERDVVTGELAPRTLQRPQMCGQEFGARFTESGLRQLLAQHRRPIGQFAWLRGGCRFHGPAQCRITGVGVDESGFQTVECQSQTQIFGDERVRVHGNRR